MVGMIPAAARRTGRKGTGTEVGGGWVVKVLSVLIKTCTYVRRGGRDEGQKSVWGGVKCSVLDRRRRHHRPFTINRMDGWVDRWTVVVLGMGT